MKRFYGELFHLTDTTPLLHTNFNPRLPKTLKIKLYKIIRLPFEVLYSCEIWPHIPSIIFGCKREVAGGWKNDIIRNFTLELFVKYGG
jgi:hypothetical protein